MKSIKGFGGRYKASSDGRIWSEKKQSFLTPRTRNDGYQQLTLCHDGARNECYVHRLIAETFIDNINNFPQVNHIDENKSNNAVSNLEWCTARYNINWGTAPARRRSKWTLEQLRKSARHAGTFRFKRVVDLTTGISYETAAEASKKSGVNRTSIVSCCKGRYKTAGDHQWAYAEVV
jgi:hypothetical protein